MTPHRIEPGEHPGGLIVGYGAPPRHAFVGALDALRTMLAQLNGP